MKLTIATLALLLLPALGLAQDTPPATKGKAVPELKSSEQIAAYAIGMNFGAQLKDAEPDVDALIRGIRDAVAGNEPAVSKADMEKAMMAFAEKMQAKMAEQAKVVGGKAKKEGEAFLAANGKKTDVKTTASGLQYKVLKSGDGASPKKTSTVKVHYHGTFPDGKVFDSSVERKEPAEFPVNQVIAGWTEALQLMKVGDKWQLTIPSDLAYGPNGRPGIPPNQVLLFDVELLEIVK